jgi:hypothetical protein
MPGSAICVAVRLVSAGRIATSAREIESALFKARAEGGLVICAPVYCELLAYPSATRHFGTDGQRLCGLCPTSSSIARRLSQAAAGGLHRSRTRPASRRPSYDPGCQSLPAGFSEAAPLMSGRIWISTCAAAGLFTVMSRLLTATATTSPSSSFLPDPDVPAAPPPKDRYERCAV